MKTSSAGLSMLMQSEGFRDTAYRDGGGIWTIAYGHTLGVGQGLTCLEEQGAAWLTEDLAWAEAAISRNVRVPLDQRQFDALVSFVFNVGQGAFVQSTLLRKLNAGDVAGAADEFPRWVHDAQGNVEPGLVTRRARERALFLQGVTA